MSKSGAHLQEQDKKINKKLIIILSAVVAVAAIVCLLVFVVFNGDRNEPVDDTLDMTPENVEPAPEEEAEPDPEPDSKPKPEPEPEIEVEPVFTNPLNGKITENDISAKRPYAVMINNIKKALPQHGIGSADIIYEVPVEGDITRMMAIYQDISVTDIIGSVRSARPYYIDILRGYDAIYVHAGGSNEAYMSIRNNDIDNIDGVNGSHIDKVFYRDSWRKNNLGYEHSLMAKTEEVLNYAEEKEMRLEHGEDYVCNMTFDDEVFLEGESANKIDVHVTASKNTEFEYDAQTDTYLVSQYKREYIDNNDESRVSVKNVIAIFADTRVIDKKGRLRITLEGSGEGYFACSGKYVPITWIKNSADENFIFTFKDGTPITFEEGTSYICVCSAQKGTAKFE